MATFKAACTAARKLIAGGRYSEMPVWAAGVDQLVDASNRNGRPAIWLRTADGRDRPVVTDRDFPPGRRVQRRPRDR